MEILFYILIGIFGLLGIGSLKAGITAKRISTGAGGLMYLGCAMAAYLTESWWPFLIGFAGAWVIKLILGE